MNISSPSEWKESGSSGLKSSLVGFWCIMIQVLFNATLSCTWWFLNNRLNQWLSLWINDLTVKLCSFAVDIDISKYLWLWCMGVWIDLEISFCKVRVRIPGEVGGNDAASAAWAAKRGAAARVVFLKTKLQE
jgi:hypothetical protein